MPNFVGMMPGTSMGGPIRALDTRSGSESRKYRQASLTLTAVAAGAAGTFTIADSQALPGDVICVSPVAAPPAGMVIASAYCAVEGTISVVLQNAGGGAFTAGPLVVRYTISS